MEQEKPNYYAVLPANIRYDTRLKPNEKLLYSEITALSNKTGLCYATNKYFANLYEVEIETISRWIKNLKDLGYITTEIIYKDTTKEIEKRIIKINGVPIDKNVSTYLQNNQEGYSQNNQGGIDEKVKDNNTSINITSMNNKLNEFNLYNNFAKNLQCECISKTTKERCNRKSSYNINGKNYCNQHSREFISKLENHDKRKNFVKPTLEELKEYCNNSSLSVDCQYFYDYYESNGWLVGKNKMKDWKATLRNWSRRNAKQPNSNSKNVVREYVDELGFKWRETSDGKRDFIGTENE